MTKVEKQMNDPYLTPKDVSILLKCSLKTVYSRTIKGVLKRHSFGGRKIYYLRSEVESAMFKLD